MVSNRFENQVNRVYTTLRQMILDGTIGPGEKIGIRETAARLGTSNGPIRDALLQLNHEKLVEGGYRSEWIVAKPTREMIDDAMTVREAIEAQSARLCARNATPEDIEHLRKLAQQIDNNMSVELKDEPFTLELEGRFHIKIAELSGLPQLCEEVKRWKVVMDWADLYMKRIVKEPAAYRRTTHVEVVQAIESDDAEFAERQMRHHIRQPWDYKKWITKDDISQQEDTPDKQTSTRDSKIHNLKTPPKEKLKNQTKI